MSVMMRNGVQYAGVPDERLDNLEEIVGDGQQTVGSDLTDAVTQLNSSLNNKIDELELDRTYSGTIYCGGYVTSNSTELFLTPHIKIPHNATAIQITAITLSIRTTDGTYAGGSNGYNALNNITNRLLIKEQDIVRLSFTLSTKWTNTNNTPVNGYISMTYKFV